MNLEEKKNDRDLEFRTMEERKEEISNLKRRKRSQIYEFGRKKIEIFSNLE